MINKLVHYDYKNALLGFLAIFAYFTLSSLEALPFSIAHVNIDTIPNYVKIGYLMIYEILSMSIILLIFHKKIERDFEDILIHHKEYYSKYIKVWLIGLMVMLLSNSFIIFILQNDMSGNESAVRSLFQISPLYIYLTSTLYAPCVEELVFRQGICNILGRNRLFILVSGIVFGGLHIIGNIQTTTDILYLIPYSSLGIAFAYMLYKTDNIFVSMGFHFLHNGLLVSLQFLTLLF